VASVYYIVFPSAVVGTLMVLVDIYGAPWFATLWWSLH
jgi:hypothetical protein